MRFATGHGTLQTYGVYYFMSRGLGFCQKSSSVRS